MRAKFISIAIHVAILAALLLLPFTGTPRPEKLPDAPTPPVRLHLLPVPEPKPGGGGTRSITPPAKGQLPQFAHRTFVPPVQHSETPSENPKPLLAMEASIAVELPTTSLALVQFGDPMGAPGMPSGGRGLNGIGDHGNGGIGNRDGAGYDSASSIGGEVTGPVPIYKPDPEFSEEARKAKLQGVVVLEVEVDVSGRAHIIRVREGLGLGLDEKAIEAVQVWRFRPGRRNGKAIAVPATIYINFRLL